MLIDKIKEDLDFSRKNHSDATSLLTLMYAECMRIAKDKKVDKPSDSEVVSVLKKILNGISESISYIKNNPFRKDQFEKLNFEEVLIKQYIPSLMSEDELREKIQLILRTGPKQIGFVMGELKKQYPGAYDGTLASKIVKEFI